VGCRVHTVDMHQSVRTMNRPISLKVCLCFTCTASFFDEQSWKVHRRRHHSAKQYLCTPSTVFTAQETSTSHSKRQTEEQMYSCNHHQLVHIDVKSFGCILCDKSFKHKISVVKHFVRCASKLSLSDMLPIF